MDSYYRTSHANVHRGAHSLANKATELYEIARQSVQKFINAQHREEIIFTRGATDAINIVAQSYTQYLKAGDEIILSVMEHHSNLVPWQMAAQR
jgi:cysteine desulfurase/selenocysteine lyase